MEEQALGEIIGVDGCYRIQTNIVINADIEDVWETATDSERVGWWFAPGTVGNEGDRIQLNYTDGEFGMAGDVKVLLKPHVFEFTWDAHEHSDQTIVRFDFMSVADKATLATMTSLVFDNLETTYLVIATWRFMLEF